MRALLSLRNVATGVIPPSPALSSLRSVTLLTRHFPRFDSQNLHKLTLSRHFSTNRANMSFSNTSSIPSDKPADPYKEKNLQEPELKEKIEDLVTFMEHCKFGMMTTRIASSGLLTSRCMALAAKVRTPACLALKWLYIGSSG